MGSLAGVPGLLGGLVAPTASAATQAAIGGALFGGGGAALTGQDSLKGALLGGLGGYAGNAFNEYMGASALDEASQAALRAADEYAMAGSLTAGDLAAQLGVSLEDARDILTSAGGYLNAGSVDELLDFYSKQALDAADLYESTGTLTAADLASQLGVPVSEIANILGPTSVLGAQALGGAAGGLLSGSNLQNLLKILAGLGATKAVGSTMGGGGFGGVGALPTQGVPTYSPGYFQAVQQSYNQYMPNAPRDIAGPLEQWYNSKYGS